MSVPRVLVTAVVALVLCIQLSDARAPVFDDDDDEFSGGRSDQHVATVPLEHSFGGPRPPHFASPV